MLNPDIRAELEQDQAFLVEALPPLWWGLYKNCIEEGFTNTDALSLVETFIMSQNQ